MFSRGDDENYMSREASDVSTPSCAEHPGQKVHLLGLPVGTSEQSPNQNILVGIECTDADNYSVWSHVFLPCFDLSSNRDWPPWNGLDFQFIINCCG